MSSESQLCELEPSNWVDRNARLRCCLEDKHFLYNMAWDSGSYKVVKAVFQGLKVAVSKLANCQNLAKSGGMVRKVTLELHSGKMGSNQGRIFVPHESVFVFLQKQGIG
ncbi:unnamed protein product [Linum trigynum]|uniref:Uncharacterized protein n=1 Tax=Linum trigynum TaxID=586398 RepID=A0AAV2EYW8_9ROSI